MPFEHFFCPILYRDAPAELCLGHIVNASLTGSDKYRVIQRTDVDCFFGSVCESYFVHAHEGGGTSLDCPTIRAATIASLLKAAQNAIAHFAPYAALVRRVLDAPAVSDRSFSPHEFCWRLRAGDADAHVPVIPVRGSLYAVTIPTLGLPVNDARFLDASATEAL